MEATQKRDEKPALRTFVIGPLPSDPGFEPTEEEKMAALRAALDEGLASGTAPGGVFERVRRRLGLPMRP